MTGAFRGAGAFLLILSSESLLFALNSGCLNSHAYLMLMFSFLLPRTGTDIWSIRWYSAFFIVLAHFVKVVLVQLPNKTGEVAVLEVFGKYRFGEFLVL